MNERERERILDKIRKCFALGKSPNPNEAAAAMRQAEKLMSKHGLTMTDVEISEARAKFAAREGNRNAEDMILFNTVWATLGVGGYLDMNTNEAVFVGAPTDVELAKYAYEALKTQLKTAVNAYGKSLRKPPRERTKLQRAFRYAWAAGVRDQLEEYKERNSLDLKIVEFMRGKGLVKLNATRGVSLDPAALDAGRRAGRSARLHDGVHGAPTGGRLLGAS